MGVEPLMGYLEHLCPIQRVVSLAELLERRRCRLNPTGASVSAVAVNRHGIVQVKARKRTKTPTTFLSRR
jgi:hypothetical protein